MSVAKKKADRIQEKTRVGAKVWRTVEDAAVGVAEEEAQHDGHAHITVADYRAHVPARAAALQ